MSDPARILVCEDEPQILRALRVILRDAGYEAVTAETGEEALDRAAVKPPAAAIVDLMLPDIDGVEVTERLREWSEMPIILLSAVGEEVAKVRALAAGADDYVTKPFGPPELVARLEAVLRRSRPEASEPVVAAEGLEIDLAARVVRRDGDPVHLTPTEFELLRTLAQNRGRLMTHRALLVEVWGIEYADDFQVLRHQAGPAVHQQHQDIGFGNGQFGLAFDQGHHAFRRGRFEPSGIDKPKRPVPVIGLRIVPISCDARHVVYDRRFLSQNAVEQGRFTDIRPTDDGNGWQRGRELDRERRW